MDFFIGSISFYNESFQKGINLVKILYAIFYDPPGFEIYTKKLVVHNVRVLLVELKP